MGNKASLDLVGAQWTGANDTLNEGEKKYVQTKISENECFIGYNINIDEMISHMDRGVFTLNQFVFKKGQRSDALYVVLKGTCDIYQGDKKIGVYNKGSIMGDTGLKSNITRTFTVKCSSAQCEVLRLTKVNYDKLLAEYKHRKESRLYKTLFSASCFYGIPPETIKKIEDICEEKTFHEGNVIVKKDSKSNHAYVIKSGFVKEQCFNGVEDTMKHGQFFSFGEESILADELCCYYNSTVIATEYTTCIVVDSQKLRDFLPDSVMWKIESNVTSRLKALRRLRTDPEFILNNTISEGPTEVTETKSFLSSLIRTTSSGVSSPRTFSLKDIPMVDEPKDKLEETKEELPKKQDRDDTPLLTDAKKNKKKVVNEDSPATWLICCVVPEVPSMLATPPELDDKKKKKKKTKAV